MERCVGNHREASEKKGEKDWVNMENFLNYMMNSQLFQVS